MLAKWDGHWAGLLERIAPELHAVDRDGVKIWFEMWPLVLHQLVEGTAERPVDGAEVERFYQLKGQYRLKDLPDTSHRYLYGHRYWGQIKEGLALLADSLDAEDELESLVRTLAGRVSAPKELTLGMAAIGWMTLRQCGTGFLKNGFVSSTKPGKPEEMLRERASAFRPGLLNRLQGAKACERVIFDESQGMEGWFEVLPSQEITTAAELDKRPYHLSDPRCYEGMGPIPVDCRSGSCGTCWVGILGGNQNMEPVGDFERKRMEYFGYWDSGLHRAGDEKPLLRLACQAQVKGSVSIVIPPWNGVFGESRRTREAAQNPLLPNQGLKE
jgi:ferredoxin